MSNTKLINKFYRTYKILHKTIENEIKDNSYISSRVLDRIIVFLFIENNFTHKKIINNLKMYSNKKGITIFKSLINFYSGRVNFLEEEIDEVEFIINVFKVDMIENNIDISDLVMNKVISELSKYNWTLNSSEENSINLDILGNVFEKYINQKENGAYYTEIDTIKYINENTILLYLLNNLNSQEEIKLYISKTFIKINEIKDLVIENIDLVKVLKSLIIESNINNLEKNLLNILDNIKILDPTCGTGAFLINTADLLEDIYLTIFDKLNIDDPYIIIKIINNNIYGIDIMEDAIDIAKFRLYLKIIQRFNKSNINILKDELKINLVVGNTLTDDIFKKLNNIEFDCIVGNPPYIEYSKIKNNYTPKNISTIKSGNLYAFVIEKSIQLLKEKGTLGLIIPISIVSTKRMECLRKFIEKHCIDVFYSHFGDRPGTLFNGVHQKLTIFIGKKENINMTNIYTSSYYHWYKEERPYIFNNIKYIKNDYRNNYFYYKVGNNIEKSIIDKIINQNYSIDNHFTKESNYNAYLNPRMTFWVKCFKDQKLSSEFKKYSFTSDENAWIFISVMNSSLYYFFWECISDAWHITSKDLTFFNFDMDKLTIDERNKLINLAQKLENDLESKKVYIGSKQIEYEYKHKKSKTIIDEIDKVLMKYYNLTKEEFFYVINYNLKYRMNDELDNYLMIRKDIIEEISSI